MLPDGLGGGISPWHAAEFDGLSTDGRFDLPLLVPRTLDSMDLLSLIVRGDDFGLCHAANQAICEAFETGLLTCASLLVTTPWLAEAVTLAQGHAEWELGLQLTLHCPTAGYRWGPVLGAAAVPSLVEP